MDRARSWVTASFTGPDAKPPFSFVCGGDASAELVGTWNHKRTEAEADASRVRRILTHTDPTGGLSVECATATYTDFPAIEWVLHFENAGKRDTPILSEVHAADLVLPGKGTAEFVLHHSDGSQGKVSDFRPRTTRIGADTTLRLAPDGGRSSDGVMPYFNVARPDGGGVIIAIGWSGQWAADFARQPNGGLRVRAGMERTHLRLQPGERIRTPAILLLFYGGDAQRGHNLLRQLMRTHYTPRPGGRPIELPVAASGATMGFNSMTEANQVQAVTNISKHKLPVDTYWVDAGWSTGGFPEGMGTWDPDPTRFPNGLRPVADAAHEAGLRFLAWFEPERVMPDTWLRVTHPKWLLAPDGLPPELAYQEGWRLLNLGNPATLKWAKEKFSSTIRSVGIDIYRHDFNMHPLYYWRAGEAPDRQGLNEIRYVTGLYDYFDTLARENANLVLDNCASGGRRLDFEMMRRSVPLWRSDYCWDPIGAQCITYGLSYWLPLHGLGAVSADAYDFRSGMGANGAFAFDYYTEQGPLWPALTARIREYRRLRKFYSGDYYPLTPYTTANDAWIAWQFDRPDPGQGMVQAFRRPGSTTSNLRTRLHGLDPDERYSVRDLDTGTSHQHTGQQLMTEGLDIALKVRPGSTVVVYERSLSH